MKIPVSPPNFIDIMHRIAKSGELINLVSRSSVFDDKGRYVHWDKLRHLTPPDELTHEQWWFAIKSARNSLSNGVSLVDKHQSKFNYSLIDAVHKQLHWLDRHACGAIQSSEAITNAKMRDTYLIRSLIEEAINSSQLEGASTTREVAKEMIRQQRAPKDKSEQMIFNNYHAMQFIREIKDEKLTPSIVFELHKILTKGALNDNEVGRFRTENDDIHVVDNATQDKLHTPPLASELDERLQKMCDFANSDSMNDKHFIHPMLRAIILHFMLAYDHPFCDGNGRVARALFYWLSARHGYWLVEFVSISRVIKKSSTQYGKAFLHTETDDNDLTYFILHQLDVIRQAIDALHHYLDIKIQGISEAEQKLVNNPKLKGKLNYRQLALLRHALKHPRFSYVVDEHQISHGISYDIARKDLLEMADNLKLLVKTKQGRRYFFVAPNDLENRISK